MLLGPNDDATRVQYVRHDLTLLSQAGIGFLPHALHHSPVADLHRPVPGPKMGNDVHGFHRTRRFNSAGA